MNKEKEMKTFCPRCGIEELDKMQVLNALSRKDNETYVCSPCGIDEAVWDFMKSEHPEWPLPKHYVKFSFEQLMKK
tara:strand:- start:498 stop:725 length:228 start_codon:yes stop_codon:yes gene_type:complete